VPSGPDLVLLLVTLADAGVEFVVVGGFAAVAHGAPYVTFDVDLVHSRTPKNVSRLLAVLPTLDAFVRGRHAGERVLPGREALLGPGHQLLERRLGALDVLGEVDPGQTYETLLPFTQEIDLRGRRVRLVTLDKLIELKRAAGREKDRLVLPVLEELARTRDD
jgi:predicted nucleotidyltransferase